MGEECWKTGRVENGNIALLVRGSFEQGSAGSRKLRFHQEASSLTSKFTSLKPFLASSSSSRRKFISRLFWEEFTTAHLRSSFFSCLHFPEFSLAGSTEKCLSGLLSPRGYVCRWTESCFRPGSENSGGCLASTPVFLLFLTGAASNSALFYAVVGAQRIKKQAFPSDFFPLMRVLTRISTR